MVVVVVGMKVVVGRGFGYCFSCGNNGGCCGVDGGGFSGIWCWWLFCEVLMVVVVEAGVDDGDDVVCVGGGGGGGDGWRVIINGHGQ